MIEKFQKQKLLEDREADDDENFYTQEDEESEDGSNDAEE
jgi:hypothetical protein